MRHALPLSSAFCLLDVPRFPDRPFIQPTVASYSLKRGFRARIEGDWYVLCDHHAQRRGRLHDAPQLQREALHHSLAAQPLRRLHRFQYHYHASARCAFRVEELDPIRYVKVLAVHDLHCKVGLHSQ